MKRSRDAKSKNSSKEHHRKQSVGATNGIVTKMSKTIPLAVPTKLGTLNSTRLKPQVEAKSQSSQASRKGSFQ